MVLGRCLLRVISLPYWQFVLEPSSLSSGKAARNYLDPQSSQQNGPYILYLGIRAALLG